MSSLYRLDPWPAYTCTFCQTHLRISTLVLAPRTCLALPGRLEIACRVLTTPWINIQSLTEGSGGISVVTSRRGRFRWEGKGREEGRKNRGNFPGFLDGPSGYLLFPLL